MGLAAGMRIGPYEVALQIGAGGMGEVYRATDTNLNRPVAIKVLPDAFSGDADRLARFQREARLLAALNHPNIAQVHGLEQSHGTTALVMELVEGPTLADRIAQGAIPVAETLAIARQIALALEAAHEQGIVHRDLKPANIKVRPDGAVKVLDFGLAKVTETPAVAAAGGATRSPTVTTPALTYAGVILGTAAYMSPEQAKGRPVDERTDVWAWGCVVYEMLTGRRAFPGSDVADVLGAVIHREPDWQALPKMLPPVLGRFLRQCMQKAPGERVRAMGDVRLALDGAFEVETSSRALGRRAALGWVAGALALTAVVTALAVWNLRPGQGRPVSRFAHVLPAGQAFTQGVRPLVAVAPDGSSVVYASNNQLYRRMMGALEATPIIGTEGAPSGPFFSPDGQTIGYWDRLAEQVRVVSVAGGTPVALASASSFYSGSWGADDAVVFGQENGVWRVQAGGGAPEHVVKIETGERVHGPHMLPDGDSILFALVNVGSMGGSATAWDSAQIVVQSVATGERTALVRGSDPRYVPTGHLVYALGNTLLGVRFDPARRAIVGRPVPIVEDVQRPGRTPGSSGTANYDFSRDGTLAYVALDEASLRPQQRMLVAVDLQGRTTPLVDEVRQYWRPRIAPDGTRVVVEVVAAGGDAQLWVVDLTNRLATPLTGENEDTLFPAWTPDSRSVVYRGNRGGRLGIYALPADGTRDAELLLETVVETVPTDISRDGVLAFAEGPQTGERSIRLLDLARKSASDFLDTPAREHMPVFSPDGKWMAYASDESGRMELYVRPYPRAPGVGRRVSLDGGDGPVWAPDGGTLYYRGASGDLMAVPITLNPGVSVGRPRSLFRFTGTFVPSGNTAAYDIHPDGTRFIMVTEDPDRTPPVMQIHIVQGWFEELRRLVPVE